jgi:hypothetical protein
MGVLRDENVYVLFAPLRVSPHDTQDSRDSLRDGPVLHLAATLLRRGDVFARECLSQTDAARTASLRGKAPDFHDPMRAAVPPGID